MLGISRATAELADVLAAQGEYHKAEELCHDTLERQRRNLGAGHSDTLGTMSDLARMLSVTGRNEEAIPLKAKLLERHRNVAGEDALVTLEAQVDYGISLLRQGGMGLAETHLDEALDGMPGYLGTEHQDMPTVMVHLAAVYGAQERYAEAEALFREAVKISERVLAENDRRTLLRRGHLATALRRVGKLDEAEQLYREVIADPRPGAWLKKVELSQMLLNQDRKHEAEPFLMQAQWEARQCARGSHGSARIREMSVLAEIGLRNGIVSRSAPVPASAVSREPANARLLVVQGVDGVQDCGFEGGHETEQDPRAG